MNRTLTKPQEDLLEQFIDHTSVEHILNTIADIASAKAEHIAQNWQDSHLAKRWNNAAKSIGACASSATVRGVS